MARKQANAPKSPSKSKPSKTQLGQTTSSPTSGVDASASGQASRPRGPAQAAPVEVQNPVGGLGGWKFRMMFMIVPLIQMLLRPEAPRKPFSAVRSPTTGDLLQTPSGEPLLIDPRILFVLSQPLDIAYFAPTVMSLTSDEKKEGCEVFVVNVCGGADGEGKDALWEGLGIPADRHVILDIPSLDCENPQWDPKDVKEAILPYITDLNIDTILSFSNSTPSLPADPHHVSLHTALSSLISDSSPSSPSSPPPPSSPLLSAFAKLSSSVKGTAKEEKEKVEQAQVPEVSFPRLFELEVPAVYLQFLGPFSPLAEHFALLYRVLVGDKTFVEAVGISKLFPPSQTSDSDVEKSAENTEKGSKTRLPTTFISDIKSFFRSWRAVVGVSGGDPVSIAKWSMDRDLWVNRWREVARSA